MFEAPKPSPVLIHLMTRVNRVVMLHGVPGLRDVLPFNRLAGLRGVADVRHIDFPERDRARLTAACGSGKATFITPNHPEFFTDWMIDKEIISQVSPLAACWATHGVVNGLGRVMQRFWLANNLIAQIPGNSQAAKQHSIDWAVKGHGVLLHPEGGVGWHGNLVAPLLPGAVEMGLEALQRGRAADPAFQAWVVPVVWKLAFTRDVEHALARECAYVETGLGISREPGSALPARILHVYETLLGRDEESFGLAIDRARPFAERQRHLVSHLCRRLRDLVPGGAEHTDSAELLRLSRRWLRDNPAADPDMRKAVKATSETIQRLLRLGQFAFARARITQEEIAEHLKRLRNDYCKGSLRDTLNRFVPQPAGPRRAHIRVPEPLALHGFGGSVDEALDAVRRRMQRAIDDILTELEAGGGFIFYPNSFYHPESVLSDAHRTL